MRQRAVPAGGHSRVGTGGGPAGRGRANEDAGLSSENKHQAEINYFVVSNEVFSGGSQYGEGTLEYLRLLGEANRILAAWADSVCEVSCGIPIYHKGGEQC